MAKPIPTDIPDDVKARFWAKVDVRGPSECWPWKGRLYEGYGSFGMFSHGMKAHRAAQFIVGDRPAAGEAVDHICRNRACCNPAHLRNVSGVENTMCGEGITARRARSTHCLRGHEFTPENIMRFRTNPNWRGCRACHRMRTIEYRARKNAKRLLSQLTVREADAP